MREPMRQRLQRSSVSMSDASALDPAVGASSITQRHAATPGAALDASRAIVDGAWVQLARDAHRGLDDDGVRAAAAHGTSGGGGALPHLEAIQRAFGPHDVSGVTAHTDAAASDASRALGAHAFATGDHVAFADASPSLFLVAH